MPSYKLLLISKYALMIETTYLSQFGDDGMNPFAILIKNNAVNCDQYARTKKSLCGFYCEVYVITT